MEIIFKDWSPIVGTANEFFAIRQIVNKTSHYSYAIMSAMAAQITSLTIVYSTINSRRRSKKTSKLRVTGLCEGN